MRTQRTLPITLASAALVALLATGGAMLPVAPSRRSEPASPRATQAIWSDRFVSSVGIATHFNYYDLIPYGPDRAKTVASLIGSGARFARDGLIVHEDGDSNDPFWNTMRDLTRAGMRLVLLTGPTQLRNGVTDSLPYTDQRPIDTALARVGAAGILAFEGPNEVDNNSEQWGGKSAYGANAHAYQSAMYAHARQVAPGTTVLGLTTTTAAGARAVGDLSAVMDAGTLHPYPEGSVPTARLESTKLALSALNPRKKPWWVTETGYYTAPNATALVYQPGVSESAQAKYIGRLYLDYFAAGIPQTAVYELIDEHDDRTNAEANFGLLYNDGTPKPSYQALRNLLTLLGDRGPEFAAGNLSYSLSGASATIRQLLFQKRDGRFYLALWNDISVYEPKSVGGLSGRLQQAWERVAGADRSLHDLSNPPAPVTIILASKSRRMKLYAPYKSETPLSTTEGASSLLVPVPDYPVVVEITP